MGAKLTRFRRWLAIKLCPELKNAEQRWLRLRNTLSLERHWRVIPLSGRDLSAREAK